MARVLFRQQGGGEMNQSKTGGTMGFAPSNYTCPYHTWKPGGVVRDCTCSPAPAQQLRWEREFLDFSEGPGGDREVNGSFFSSVRDFLSRAQGRSLAVFFRDSGESLVSILNDARNRVAGCFLRVFGVVKSGQGCETEIEKGGGPACRA
jgi:hypothetical protein